MADMKKLLHTFDEADEILNGKIERTNLSTIVASATASVENKKTVLIRGTGRNIESLKVGGRTVQDGVPTPDAPVEVLGVGDKTVNIFDKQSEFISGKSVDDAGNVTQTDGFGYYSTASIVKPNCTYTVSGKITANNMYGRIYFYDKSHTFISRSDGFEQTKIPYTFVTPNNAYYIGLQVRIESYDSNSIQIQEGSVATPYEPYGKYKIPVSCGEEVTNIYLDSPLFEGETVDIVGGIKDKKLKSFTIETIIEDDWVYANDTDHPWLNRIYLDSTKPGYTPVFDRDYNDDCVPICNYFKGQATVASGTSTQDGHVNFGRLSNAKGMIRFGLYSSGIKSVSEFKTWLEARATEGKPLTIWYESTEPTTETFDTSPIPTTSGNNELAINTEVTPTSIDVTSFGDYYSKAEVDKMIYNMEKVVEYENVIDVTSTAATKIPFATMFPNVNKENVTSLVVMTAPYTNDNIVRYFDTLMALRITSAVNQKVSVRVKCVYK